MRKDELFLHGSRKKEDRLFLHRSMQPLGTIKKQISLVSGKLFKPKKEQIDMFDNVCEGMCGV